MVRRAGGSLRAWNVKYFSLPVIYLYTARQYLGSTIKALVRLTRESDTPTTFDARH